MNRATDGMMRIEDVPMHRDRTDGWNFIREYGDVFQAADGTWYLTSTEAVRFAHRHPDIFASAEAYTRLGSPVPLVPIGTDRPDHKKYRRVLDPMMAPRVINGMDDELRHQVRILIEAFAGRGECDVVADLGRLYPTQVFLTLFGLPLEDRDQFIYWAETIVENSSTDRSGETNAEVLKAGTELFTYLQSCVDEKRARPGDDMLSRVLTLPQDQAWSNDEVLGLCFLFVLAGLDTVTASIGFIMYHLARHPELRRALVTDPALVNPAIEEVLRLELPAPTNPRVTTREVEVCGRTIPAGADVVLCLATVNRDPEHFAQPDNISLDQADTGHFTFGGGIHRCLGSHLARRELRLLVEEFHKLIPEYQLAPGADPQVHWPSGTLHLKSVPLVWSVP